MDTVRSPRQRTLAAVADDVAGLVDRNGVNDADRGTGRGIVRVGVDGVDGAGKTVFADELAGVLEGRGLTAIRASLDGFHHPREHRYRRGRSSPTGFFLDSYDYVSLQRLLLSPLGPGGDRRFVRAIYDVDAERAVERRTERAPEGSVLVVDGIFLHRDELRGQWDYSVFLDVDFTVSIPRGAQRWPGGDPDPDSPANRRYVEGQRAYLRTCQPMQRASVVIDNGVLDAARIVARRAVSDESGRGA